MISTRMEDTRDDMRNEDGQFTTPDSAADTDTSPEGEHAESGTETEELQAEVERLQSEAAENLQNFQRAVADLQNYRRRKEQETQRQIDRARHEVLLRILPVVDDFHRALNATTGEAGFENWVEGFKLIERKLWSALESEGVQPMESVGEAFDPNLHEAVMVDESADNPDTVVEEFQRGYYINDQVLRPAMVKVGTANELKANQGENSSSKQKS